MGPPANLTFYFPFLYIFCYHIKALRQVCVEPSCVYRHCSKTQLELHYLLSEEALASKSDIKLECQNLG